MGKVYLDFDEGIPRYVCTDCASCTSVMGQSLCSIKNRGCCSYFPEFSLVDIHHMSKTLEGLKTLETILRQPGTEVHPYHIHARGHFDKKGYEEYQAKGPMPGTEKIQDHTIFFRACPFVRSGHGCTLPPKFRNYICNFFICDEILCASGYEDAFRPYLEERSRYARWIHRENQVLRHLLLEEGLNLKDAMMETVEFLQGIPVEQYEFPYLEPVEIPDSWSRGA